MKIYIGFFSLVLLVLLASASHEEADKESAYDGTNEAGKNLNILLISDHLVGHMTNLLAVGEQLVQRGHNVTYLLILHETDREKYKSLVEKHGIHLWNVSAEGLPQLTIGEQLKKLSNTSFLTIMTKIRNHMTLETQILAKHLNRTLSAGEWDFMIALDFLRVLMPCMNAIHKTPHLYIGQVPSTMHLYPTWPWPGIVHGASSDNLGFKDRALNVIEVLIGLKVYGYFMLSGTLAKINEYCPSVTISDALSQIGVTTPYIIPTVIGFEYARTINPLTEYTGPLIAQAAAAPLTGELKEWLSNKPDRSVVYISTGSMWDLDKRSGRACLEGVMDANFSLLWSLRRSNQWILEGLDVDTDRVLISDWTPQFSVLGSSAVHSAILHGGFNGLSEALWNSVPILVVPQMHEQVLNAGRAHFNGLGIHLDTDILSSSVITESLKALDTGEYRSKVAKLQKVMRMAGGVERAADLVEFYVDVGYSHLVPAYNAKYQWSWVQYYNADVYALLLLVLIVVIWSVKTCCKYICKEFCCNKNSEKKKKD